MDEVSENVHLAHPDLILPRMGGFHGLDQLHRLVILDEEEEDGNEGTREGHQAKGMPPSPVFSHDPADGDTDGAA